MAVTDEAIEKIKGMIVSGALRPGDRLPRESELAAGLGLSRNSLREAVRYVAPRPALPEYNVTRPALPPVRRAPVHRPAAAKTRPTTPRCCFSRLVNGALDPGGRGRPGRRRPDAAARTAPPDSGRSRTGRPSHGRAGATASLRTARRTTRVAWEWERRKRVRLAAYGCPAPDDAGPVAYPWRWSTYWMPGPR